MLQFKAHVYTNKPVTGIETKTSSPAARGQPHRPAPVWSRLSEQPAVFRLSGHVSPSLTLSHCVSLSESYPHTNGLDCLTHRLSTTFVYRVEEAGQEAGLHEGDTVHMINGSSIIRSSFSEIQDLLAQW